LRAITFWKYPPIGFYLEGYSMGFKPGKSIGNGKVGKGFLEKFFPSWIVFHELRVLHGAMGNIASTTTRDLDFGKHFGGLFKK
jgi:hypothetical protein